MAVLLVGCAHHSYYWKTESWAKTNLAEAHNDCTVKAAVAVGARRDEYDFGYGSRYNAFMNECMAGQGYIATEAY